MTEYDDEPIRGLPGIPPAGEQILWQGAPEWRVLARTAFHAHLVAGYFAVLTAFALIGALRQGVQGPGDLIGTAMTVIVGILGVALLHLLARRRDAGQAADRLVVIFGHRNGSWRAGVA